jgi:hypothetical protein
VEKHMMNLNNYNPYQNMDSWYGVPDYGGAYNSYMSMQQQPLSLGRLVSMVREIQDGMGRQPLGNNAVNVSAPTQMEIPAQIAASIMNTQNRLLSMPRQRWAESGGYNLPDTAHDPNAPADNVVGDPAVQAVRWFRWRWHRWRLWYWRQFRAYLQCSPTG